MPDQFIQWLIGQAGLGGVAALALWMLREAYKERKDEKSQMFQIVQSNTQAMTMLASVVERNTQAVDRNSQSTEQCELAQTVVRSK